jgi:hypothetical protein
MSTTLESLPTTWSTADETFFHVVASVFPTEFTAGAGVLLGSYDDEQLPVLAAVPTTRAAAGAERSVRVTA